MSSLEINFATLGLAAPDVMSVSSYGTGLRVSIGAQSAEDALAYAKALGAVVESDTRRPMTGDWCEMRTVLASKTEPGLSLHVCGSSVVRLAETAGVVSSR